MRCGWACTQESQKTSLVRASAPLARGKTARSLAERRGWTVAGVYEDNDVSAFKTKVTRPEFGHLMEDL